MSIRLAALLPVALAAGCAAIPDDERALMTAEIDCARAEEQIAALSAARPTAAREARVLATSLTPAGFVIGAATNDFGDRERLLSGAYAEDLDTRIALIRETCDLPSPAG